MMLLERLIFTVDVGRTLDDREASKNFVLIMDATLVQLLPMN